MEISDNFSSRSDNIIIFVSPQGKPCDEGARMLQSSGRFPLIRDAMVGCATVSKWRKYQVITLVIEDNASELTQREVLKEACHVLAQT